MRLSIRMERRLRKRRKQGPSALKEILWIGTRRWLGCKWKIYFVQFAGWRSRQRCTTLFSNLHISVFEAYNSFGRSYWDGYYWPHSKSWCIIANPSNLKSRTKWPTEASFIIANGSVPPSTIVIAVHVHVSQHSSQHSKILGQSSAEGGNPIPLATTNSLNDSQDRKDSSKLVNLMLTRSSLDEQMKATQTAYQNTENAIKSMHVLDEWKGTIRNIEWLMGMVEDLSDVCGQAKILLIFSTSFQIYPLATLAWKIISPIPQVPFNVVLYYLPVNAT